MGKKKKKFITAGSHICVVASGFAGVKWLLKHGPFLSPWVNVSFSEIKLMNGIKIATNKKMMNSVAALHSMQQIMKSEMAVPSLEVCQHSLPHDGWNTDVTRFTMTGIAKDQQKTSNNIAFCPPVHHIAMFYKRTNNDTEILKEE